MRKIILGFLLSVLAASAFAAGTSDLAAIDQALNTLLDSSRGLAANSPFLEDGKRLYGILLTILVSWSGLHVVFDQAGFMAAIAKLIRVILIAGICTFMMSSSTQQSLVKGFDYAAGKAATASGSNFDMSSPAQGIKTVMARGMQAVADLWRSSSESHEKQSWLQTLANDSVLDILLGLIGEGLAKIFVSGLVIVTLGAYVFVIVSTMVLVQIGLILSPLFIPWLLWDSTAFLFNSWLKFMITSGVAKIVAALLLGMTYAMLEGIHTLAASAAANPIFDEFAYVAAALLSLLMAGMMLQVPSIAAGLVGGIPSVSINIPRPNDNNRKKSGDAPKPPAPNQFN